MEERTKFCKYCGEIIDWDCVVCVKCGKQVEELKYSHDTPVIINNTVTTNANNVNDNDTSNNNVNNNTNNNINQYPNYSTPYVAIGRPKNKWVALLLCLFTLCGHKFYEGKIIMGIIYLFTSGLFGIGWIIDIIILLGKPTTYYVQ